ncbi:MAG: AAA family ATPase [Clostridia bacterium]|nr:AAA family ATPase [Clostridia bacterium]
MEKTVVIMMGVQGSGKSTFFADYLAEEFVRVNLDTLKTRHRERTLIGECLAAGKNYGVDNTNPTRADRARYIPEARAAGYRVIGYLMQARVATCLARNSGREGKARVPDVAIYATSRKFELPHYDEGFDEIYLVDNDGAGMTVTAWTENNKTEESLL